MHFITKAQKSHNFIFFQSSTLDSRLSYSKGLYPDIQEFQFEVRYQIVGYFKKWWSQNWDYLQIDKTTLQVCIKSGILYFLLIFRKI